MLREPLELLARLARALGGARAVPLAAHGRYNHHMARLLLAALFMAAWFTVGAGLLDSRFGDWRIYVYGAIGGIGFALVSEWSRVRRFARRLAKLS
jgi:hypothetical protein